MSRSVLYMFYLINLILKNLVLNDIYCFKAWLSDICASGCTDGVEKHAFKNMLGLVFLNMTSPYVRPLKCLWVEPFVYHGDERKDGIFRCCKFYMSYGTLF